MAASTHSECWVTYFSTDGHERNIFIPWWRSNNINISMWKVGSLNIGITFLNPDLGILIVEKQ